MPVQRNAPAARARPPRRTARPASKPASKPGSKPGSTAGSTEDPARDSRPPASVRVGVFPSGNVWVDGERRGAAPLTLELRPGRHTIGVGADRPTVTRSLRVRPGQQESVVIDLSKPDAPTGEGE